MSSFGNNRSDDEATKVIYHKTARDEQKTVILPERAGQAKVGIDDIQHGVNVAGDGATVFTPVVPGVTQADPSFDPVVGWVVIIDGPGRGNFRSVRYGQNAIGRGENLRVAIDYGDQRISREAHAFLIYDDVKRMFFIRDNGKSNIVRLNGEMVLSPAELRDRDRITIGQTTLLFVALCDAGFDWLTGDAPNPA